MAIDEVVSIVSNEIRGVDSDKMRDDVEKAIRGIRVNHSQSEKNNTKPETEKDQD